MSEEIKIGRDLLAFVPSGPDWKIPWKEVESSALSAWVSRLKATMQNPHWLERPIVSNQLCVPVKAIFVRNKVIKRCGSTLEVVP